MATFTQELNITGDLNRTTAVYDTNIAQWLMHTGNCVRTPGGLWVFQKGDVNGNIVAVGAASDDAAASGNPLLVAGKYNATPTTRQEGDAVTQQMTAAGAAHVAAQGMAAHDAVASGNPVQVGGVYRVADPALADGDAGSLRVNAKGEAIVQVSGSIPAGNNNIGDVDIVSALPAGTNEIGKVQVTSDVETTISAPIAGIKTVTATAAEIFAGASAKASRRKMIVKNEDPVLRMRVGPSSVSQQNGFPIEPGATIEFLFNPSVAVAVYAISEGANLNVAVMEI